MEKSKEKTVDKCSEDHRNLESNLKNLTPLDKSAPIVASIENKFRNVMELPDEILLKIMDQLSTLDILKIALVSKRFYRLSHDQDLFKQIKFKVIIKFYYYFILFFKNNIQLHDYYYFLIF